MLKLHRQVSNQKGEWSSRYKNWCFHKNIGQTLLSFLSESLLEYHFVVLFLRFVNSWFLSKLLHKKHKLLPQFERFENLHLKFLFANLLFLKREVFLFSKRFCCPLRHVFLALFFLSNQTNAIVMLFSMGYSVGIGFGVNKFIS